jgi:hypothetical protein
LLQKAKSSLVFGLETKEEIWVDNPPTGTAAGRRKKNRKHRPETPDLEMHERNWIKSITIPSGEESGGIPG